MNQVKIKGVSIFALIMLITGAIDSIRNLPAAAFCGATLIFFFLSAALLFLIPAALISAELASTWKDAGGIFYWTKQTLGEKTGFLAIWLQWVSNIVWFPAALSFVASNVAYFFSPSLAHNKIYLISTVLLTYWIITLINLKGIYLSTRFTTFCTQIGMLLPISFLILLTIIWISTGKPTHLHFSLSNIFPQFSDSRNWFPLTAIITSFLGIELAAVHIKDIEDPQKSYPKALFYSVILILTTMISGTLSMACVLPKETLGLINGVQQVFSYMLTSYHLTWLIPCNLFLITLGAAGGIISWIISPARGLFQAAELGYLPLFFVEKIATVFLATYFWFKLF